MVIYWLLCRLNVKRDDNNNKDNELTKGGKKIDSIDVIILQTLANDARTTLKELAEITDMAISTVHARISKLISEKVIEKFTVLINPEKFDCITAFLLLKVETAKVREVLKSLVGKENVLEAFESIGEFNVVLKVRVRNLPLLQDFIDEVTKIDGVLNFECLVTTKRYKEDVWKPEKSYLDIL